MTLNLSDFIDIHTHILPGVDDGPKTLDESIALAQCYAETGIKQIIATSHFIPGTAWAASSQVILQKIEQLQLILQEKDIPLTIFPGREIAFHKKFQTNLENKALLPLAKSSWYMLEPSFSDPAGALLLCADQLIRQGWKIILAHPERIPAFQEQVDPFADLVRQGLRMQINTGSLLGRFGPDSKRVGMAFIEKGYVHYLASDAHGVDARRPPNKDEWGELAKTLGTTLLYQLCCINPAQLLEEKN